MAPPPGSREGRRAHHDRRPRARRRRRRPARRSRPASSSPGPLVTTARRAAPPRPACSSARPSHRSRQPRQPAERKRSRTGAAASTTSTPAGDAVGVDAHRRRAGGCAGGPAVGGDGAEPAQDLGRRLGHGTFDGAPGSVLLVVDLDHAAPVAAPAAHHLVDVAGQDLLVLDLRAPRRRCSGGRPWSCCETVTSKRVRLPQPSQRYRGRLAPLWLLSTLPISSTSTTVAGATSAPSRMVAPAVELSSGSGRADDRAELDPRDVTPGALARSGGALDAGLLLGVEHLDRRAPGRRRRRRRRPP